MVILVETVRENETQMKDLTRQVTDLTSSKMELITERDAIGNELMDTRDNLKECQSRLESTTSSLNIMKIDMDSKLREKDDDMENTR